MDVFIVDAIRTPIGRGKPDGALHGVHPVDLLAKTLVALNADHVEDIVCGCVSATGEQGTNIGRLAGLKAGYPIETPALQLNRFCGSGQQAIHFASQAIAAGDMEIAIGCGVESMSRVPMGSDAALTEEFRAQFPCKLLHQGISAEMIAEKWSISREEMDDFAIESHCRASTADISRQIFPTNGLTRDEGVRANPDVARMRALKPAFRADGVVTAGNSSQISDGAAAVLLASGSAAEKYGLKKRARIVARAVVGSDPELMLTGPIAATLKALKMAGLTAADIDAYEINEAFAVVPIVWAREIQPPAGRLNIEGGAIAHGHPLGATGGVLMTKLVDILEKKGGRYGLQSMCIGYGMATATVIEVLN
ncbi:MAG TPA: thiolase family protein [Bryobacteraceae bacterium]|jgi:acetyl-CoA acyltransferase|nr:thiolase family protein [Bryobacteraceae bacterium]